LTLFPVPDTAEVTYRILDDGGMVLVEDTVKTWQLPRTENQWTSDVEVSYSSDKFSPPRSGKLRLESKMTVGGRTGYTQTEMHIYDTVSDHTERAVYGTALCLVGGVVVLLGGGFLVTCMLQRRPKSSV
jgi:hypothetical protein